MLYFLPYPQFPSTVCGGCFLLTPRHRVRFEAHPSRKQTDFLETLGLWRLCWSTAWKARGRVTALGTATVPECFLWTTSRPHRRVPVWRASGETMDGVNLTRGKWGAAPMGRFWSAKRAWRGEISSDEVSDEPGSPQPNISHGQRKPTSSYSRVAPEAPFLPFNSSRPGGVRNPVNRAKKLRKMGKWRKICMPLPPFRGLDLRSPELGRSKALPWSGILTITWNCHYFSKWHNFWDHL